MCIKIKNVLKKAVYALAVLFFYALQLSAQSSNQLNVTGTVTDDVGSPVAGANVIVKGTTIGTVTGGNGQYSIAVPDGNAVLMFSFMGFIPQEITVENRHVIDVILAEDSQQLEEVVVVGYGTMERKYITSAITTLSGDKMMVGVGGADISSAIQGKIGGLVMYNLGSPNSGTTFQLRGMSSLNAGKEPLIVIDGFPGGDIRSVAAEDIKSIDILKDASAGAIYGTRAASGVILITTKSGLNTGGKGVLSYTSEFSHKQNYNAPEMLSAREYVEHGIGTDYGNDVNWWDELIKKNNFSQKHHFSLVMGTGHTQLYSSFFYEENEGISFKDERQDFGGRINVNFKLFDDWLEIRPNIDYRQARRNNVYPSFQQALRNNPTRSPFDETSETGYNVWLNESLDYNVLADAMLTDYDGTDKWFKPEISLKLNVKAIPGLSLQQQVGYENRQWEYHYFRSKYNREELTNNRKGSASLAFSKTENLTSQGYASYIKEFNAGGKHNINVTAGYDYFERNSEGFDMTNRDFSVDAIKYWNISNGSYLRTGDASMSSSKGVTERLLAGFIRVNYSLDDKYLFQASLRHEGSSKFAADNRWANFYALSAGWRISNEKFLKDISWIKDMKLRAAYGVVGNNNFSSTYMADLLSSDTNWMLPDGRWAYSYGKSQNVNPNLGWEEVKEWNVGIDYSLFDGRLYGKLDWFTKVTDNMLYSVEVPQPPYTQSSQWQNIGAMESKGWEFEIGGDIIKGDDFVWMSNINMFRGVERIRTLWGNDTYYNGNGFVAPGTPGDASRIEEGTEIGTFFIWKFAGFDENGGFQLYDKDGNVIPANQKTELDKRYQGSYMPKMILGWNHTVMYKNFDLGINLRSWIKYDVFNTLNMYYGIQGQGNFNLLKDAYGKFDHIRGEKQICDYYLEDGTFLKIDAITLGYTLPMERYTKFIRDIRIYATVGNVCTFTSYSGMNPEVNITGWTGGVEKWWENFYPIVRTYTLGLKFNF